MSSEPTPRQILYAMVAAGFLVVVAVLTAGAGAAGLVPGWWTATMGIATVAAGLATALWWRHTGRVLAWSLGLFVVWTVGTLVLV